LNFSDQLQRTVTMATPPRPPAPVLCVWDFDHSLVDDNSDTWVVQQLRPELMADFRRLRVDNGLDWTEIMKMQLESLWRAGVARADIDRCMTQLPLQPRMVETVQLIQRAGAAQASGACSDGVRTALACVHSSHWVWRMSANCRQSRHSRVSC
jgi:Putative Phosphatase